MNKPQPPVEIPSDAISPEALRGIIDDFISREGTDYGVNEVLHETKVDQILRQIAKGDVKIAFDPNEESVTLLTAKQWRELTLTMPPSS